MGRGKGGCWCTNEARQLIQEGRRNLGAFLRGTGRNSCPSDPTGRPSSRLHNTLSVSSPFLGCFPFRSPKYAARRKINPRIEEFWILDRYAPESPGRAPRAIFPLAQHGILFWNAGWSTRGYSRSRHGRSERYGHSVSSTTRHERFSLASLYICCSAISPYTSNGSEYWDEALRTLGCESERWPISTHFLLVLSLVV